MYRDGRTRFPWEEDTLVYWASATNGMATMAVLVAQSRGLLDFDEPVARYWPEFARNGKEHITLRPLLSHQSGRPLCRQRSGDQAAQGPPLRHRHSVGRQPLVGAPALGATEQIPATVTVSSPTRTFPPADQADGRGSRPVWSVAGARYEFVAITRPRFFGVAQVWVNERNQAPVFDRERALLDAFHHFHFFGSLSVALEILEHHLADVDVYRLVEHAVRLDVAAVAKRLGWAMEELGVPLDALAPLRSYPAKGDSPLDPGRPARGHHNPTWHVIENLQ